MWLELTLKFRNYKIAVSSKADHPQIHVFLVTWQRWWLCHLTHHSWKLLHANLMAVSFREPELLPVEVLCCTMGSFCAFYSCDLDRYLHVMTFIYELDHVTLYPQTKTNFSWRRLLKVVILHTYGHTDRCHRKYYYVSLRMINTDNWKTCGTSLIGVNLCTLLCVLFVTVQYWQDSTHQHKALHWSTAMTYAMKLTRYDRTWECVRSTMCCLTGNSTSVCLSVNNILFAVNLPARLSVLCC